VTTATPLGSYALYVPQDWFDLLEDGADRETTRRRCTEMVSRAYPTVTRERQSEFVDALMAWHECLLAGGTILYGIASGPMPEDSDAIANWQVMAGIVDVPTVSEELDIGSLLAAAYGSQTDEPSYQESFTTDLGIGFGFISRSTIRTGLDDETAQSAEIGLAGALTCPPGGGKGILFIGVSLDPRHVMELAGLLALMAHHSVLGDPADPIKSPRLSPQEPTP
jgi:hypothetical protein